MTSTDDRHSALLDRMADHMLDHGLVASSLRPLAKAAGTSDRMLLYYFKDKAEVIAATLERIVLRLENLLASEGSTVPLPLLELQAKLFARFSADDLAPYIRLWFEIASVAARGDPGIKAIGERIGRGFLAWGSSELDSATPELRALEAAKLLVVIEGMLLLTNVGMDDVCSQALQV